MQRAIISMVLVLASASTAMANENILTPMLGITDWRDTSGHTARGADISFKNSNETTIGFRYLYLLDSGLAVGVNSYWYEKDISTTAEAHDADIMHIHGLFEYFLRPTGSVSPFFGVGLGVSGIEFSGANLDDKSSGGASIELNAGAIFRISKRLGMQLEYKYTQFEADDNIDGQNTNIDTDVNSLLVGWTIHF